MNRPTDDNENRIRSIVDRVIGTEDPDDLMVDLMGALTEYKDFCFFSFD